MISKILLVAKFEYKRTRRLNYFGILIPSFFIMFIMLSGITLTIFSISDFRNIIVTDQNNYFVYRSLVWTIQFLIMFHSVFLVPWLFNSKHLDIYLLSSITNTLPIVLGRFSAIAIHQVVLSIILVTMSILFFLFILNLNFSLVLLISVFLSLLFAILITNLVTFACTLIFNKYFGSLHSVTSILSLYLFGLPLFMIINTSYGFIPGDFNIINLSIQLQSITNILISSNILMLFSIDLVVFFLILGEIGISLLILIHLGANLRI